MITRKKGYLDGLVPRGLITSAANVLGASVSSEGLCPLRISWENGRISKIEPIFEQSSSELKLILPRLAEPHAHIDKAFTWKEAKNLKGTYEGALKANFDEQKRRSVKSVRDRAELALRLALRNGIRAIRTHLDSFGFGADQSWEALISLKSEWKSLIELQLVALVPMEYWGTSQGEKLAKRVADIGGLLGGVLVPPFDKKKSRESLRKLLKLANKFGCGIDLHIDESQINPAEGLKQLLFELDLSEIRVPITCSHASSMGLLPSKSLRKLAARMANHHLNVIALPLTNSWLLGRKPMCTPVQRPLAPIYQLQQEGVNVAVGGDNLQDPWFPAGNLDPLALMAFSLPIAQLAPWERIGLAPFTTSVAAIMELDWDGTICSGSPADLIRLDVSSWSEALSVPPSRQVLINGTWFDLENISKVNSNGSCI